MAVETPVTGDTAGGDAAGTATGTRAGVLGRLLSWDTAVVLVTLLVILWAAASVENFGTGQNAVFLTLDLAPLLMIALPMTLIVVTGEIDLSVASTVGLSGAAMGWLWNQGLSIEAIIPICLLLGALLGGLNGVFVTVFGLPSLAVTIGTLTLYRGLATVVLGDEAVVDWPYRYTSWVTGTIGGTSIPNVAIPLVVAAVVFGVVLHATPVGRSLFAMGANEQAARFGGTRVRAVKFWLYVVSGAVAALVGVYWTLRYSSARGNNAVGLELAVVASVLLGGVSIFGGRGTLWGVVAGALLLVSLQNALRLEDVSDDALQVVTGLLLIVSVLGPNTATGVRGLWSRRRAATASR
jgi:rhamnose transport system permease protein